MRKQAKPCDVFISHALKDAALATSVSQACRDAGLETMTNLDLDRGRDPGDVIWEALAESEAFLAILSPSGFSTTMAVEFGAARARLKPIYVLVTDPSSTRIPAAFGESRLYTLENLPDVIRAIQFGSQNLNEFDRDVLIDLHRDMGITADQLALDPTSLDLMRKRFETASGKNVAGERLLTEMLRLRKRGKLEKTRRAGPLKA